jgi:pimeloyl-ACP methyl ester carboxylesterase
MSPNPRSFRFEAEEGVFLHCLLWEPHQRGEVGSETPVILLHGGGANAHWWDHLARRISARRPVYALDFRGHGDSDHPERREVDHASRFPATRGIALIDLARGSEHGSRRRARLALSLRRSYRTRKEAIERFRFLPDSSHSAEALREQIAEHSVRREPNGRFGYKFDPGWFSLPTKPRPDLDEVCCATLLVRGGESTLLSNEAAVEFVGQLALGRLVEIPDAGHHVLLDQPERLLTTLEDFFLRIDEVGANPQ